MAFALAADLPGGLDADTGQFAGEASPAAWNGPTQHELACIGNLDQAPHPAPPPRYTLSLLTLKPGLFTAEGKDATGQVWLDDLGVDTRDTLPPASRPVFAAPRAHSSHKGSYGDVAVIGGEGLADRGMGMSGARPYKGLGGTAQGGGRGAGGAADNAILQLECSNPS